MELIPSLIHIPKSRHESPYFPAFLLYPLGKVTAYNRHFRLGEIRCYFLRNEQYSSFIHLLYYWFQNRLTKLNKKSD